MAEAKKKINKNQQNSLKYLYNTRRYLFWTGFLGALLVLLTFFSIIPQINSISENYNDMLVANRQLSQLRVKVAQLEESSSSLLFSNIDRVNQTLPSHKPLLELLTGLNNVGSRAQVNFTDISLTPGNISTGSAETEQRINTANGGYERLNLDVTVTGGINNINLFLDDIENLAPFSTVTALTLNERASNVDLEATQPQFEANITITTYFFTREITSNLSTQIPELTVNQREIIEQIQNFTYSTAEQQNQIQGGGLENLFPGVGAIPI